MNNSLLALDSESFFIPKNERNDLHMKFDYCIGNPPYQENTEGTGNFKYAPPTFHTFMDAAYEIADKVEMITPAKFLFNAGNTPKAWNEKMLNDEHLIVEFYTRDCSTVFNNVNFAGGVAITYRDAGKCFGAIKHFMEYEEMNSILKKVKIDTKDDSLCSVIDVCTKFNLEILANDYPQYKEHERRLSSNILTFDCFSEKDTGDCVGIYGVIKNQRAFKFIKRKYLDIDKKIDKYKVLIPKSGGDGSFGETISKPIVAHPNTGYTHTFIGIGNYTTEQEAMNTVNYISTKFTRALLSVLKVTQDFTAEKWNYVPMQDFTSNSDIDCSQSIPDIDKQLYKKYGLTDQEIEFIEAIVKPME